MQGPDRWAPRDDEVESSLLRKKKSMIELYSGYLLLHSKSFQCLVTYINNRFTKPHSFVGQEFGQDWAG